MSGIIQLGQTGSEITLTPYGREFTEGIIEISREERTVDGTLVSDLVTTKKLFTIDYESLKGEDLESVLALYDLHTELNLRVQGRDSLYDEYTVKLRPFDYKRVSILGPWEWGNVRLECEEI